MIQKDESATRLRAWRFVLAALCVVLTRTYHVRPAGDASSFELIGEGRHAAGECRLVLEWLSGRSSSRSRSSSRNSRPVGLSREWASITAHSHLDTQVHWYSGRSAPRRLTLSAFNRDDTSQGLRESHTHVCSIHKISINLHLVSWLTRRQNIQSLCHSVSC